MELSLYLTQGGNAKMHHRPPIGQLLILIALLSAAAASAAAESKDPSPAKPRLGIIPMDAKAGDTDLSSVASSLSEFLAMDFKLSGQVEVKSLKRPAVVDFTSSIPAMIEDNKLDYILFGSVGSSAGGMIDISAYLYDAQGGRLSSGYHKLGSLLDLSDAGDAIFASLNKNIGTIHRGFCSITLSPEGSGGYDVYLNGATAGHNLSSMENLVNGKHFLEVKQVRPFSTITLVSEYLTLAEGERAVVRFKLPDVLPDELASVTSDFNEVEAKWNDPAAADTIEGDLESLESAFSDISSCPGVAPLAAKTRQYKVLWGIRKLKFDLEAAPLDFPAERLDQLKPTLASAGAYPDPGAIRSAVREIVDIEGSLQSAKATIAAGDGDWASSLDELRAVAAEYEKFGFEFPKAYAEDVRFLETLEGLYGPKPSSSAKGRKGSVAGGVALTAAALGSMATNAPSLIPTNATPGFGTNIALGLARSGLIVMQNVAFVGGASLIALGAANAYNHGGRMRDEAGAAARVYFGKRYSDAKSFVAALGPKLPNGAKKAAGGVEAKSQAATNGGAGGNKAAGSSYLVVLSGEPGGTVEIDGTSHPLPCFVDQVAAGRKLEIASGGKSFSLVADGKPRLAFVSSERPRVAAQGNVSLASGGSGELEEGAVDVSWPVADGAASYTCLIYSKASSRGGATNIRVIDAGRGTGLRFYANTPGAELSCFVYAKDKRGYASPLGVATMKARDSVPFLSDRSRKYYFLAAMGFGAGQHDASSDDSGTTFRYSLEPGILFNLVPEKVLFGAGLRFDLSKSGLADWSIDPMAVTGDLDQGVFHVYELGAASDGSTSTFRIGYGEGMGGYYFMPSASVSTKGLSPSKPEFGASIVIGRIF